MRYYTEFQAIDPKDGVLKTWEGEHIEAESFEEAKRYCEKYKGHLRVFGKLIQEIPMNVAECAKYQSDN